MIWTQSEKNGWKYVLMVTQKQALERLSLLKNLVYLLFAIASFGGTVLAFFSAVKKGKPIDKLYTLVTAEGDVTDRGRPLGEVVTKILKNHQELLEEMEADKPIRQKLFIHDLLRGEFSAEEQLLWAVEKTDLQLGGTAWLVAVFELFNGNDFYDVDLQTLEEVHIITQVLQNYLTEKYPGQTLFCTRNYKSSTVVFAVTDHMSEEKDVVRQIIEDSSQWLFSEYQIETRWGIGLLCEEPMLLWKAAEEANLSLRHSDNEHPIIEYRGDLEDFYDFYFPDIAREKIQDGICSGNLAEVNSILDIIRRENISRKLKRSRFMKLNQKISDLLSETFSTDSKECGKKKILWLNELIISPEVDQEEYFRRLQEICQYLCMRNSERKDEQRGKMIHDIMQYLNEHYMDSSLGLAQVGIVFHISEGYLSSLFKKQTGVNFADYLEEIRIGKAKELLQEGSITVSEIGEKVGYNSVQAFRRAFKRVEGISPKEARNK